MVRTLSLLLIGAVASCCSAGDFLKHLPKVDPGKLAKQSPAQLAQAVSKSASDVAKSAEDLASSPESAADWGKKTAQQGKEAVDGAKPQEQLSKALDGAAGALKRASDRVAAANTSDVKSALAHAGDAAGEAAGLPQDTSVSELIHQAGSASKDDVANGLREATPSLTSVVDRTGHHLADGVRTAGAKATAFVNRTGGRVGQALSPALHPADGEPLSEELSAGQLVESGGSAKLFGLLLLAVAAGAGYFVAQRLKQSTARSPILLSDALDTVHGDSPQSRGGAMQMTSVDETSFSRF